MMRISLTKNQFALIDSDDFDLISQYRWICHRPSSNYQVAISVKRGRKSIRMHRLIMNALPGMEIDHINGNPLDNRKCNLRFVTHAQNQKNMNLSVSNKSGKKEVSWHKRSRKWQVFAANTYIGLFSSIEEASMAYDKAAKEMFGEFARTNEAA